MKRAKSVRKKGMRHPKIARLKQTQSKIEEELAILQKFRRTPQTEKLERHLQGERSYTLRQIQLLAGSPKQQEREKEKKRADANRNRREKMKRIWRFRKAIKENWAPDKSEREIGTLYKKHREGLETDIPDIAWRNPSP